MRHLPNLLTLANLFCGALATAMAFHAQPFLYHNLTGDPSFQWGWAYGVTQIQYAGLLIILAGIFDMLDGAAARALKVYSPIGKDLDSLADVVSFGVAPAAILYQMLWDASAHESFVRDVGIWAMAPAFLLACTAALRLARFNVSAPAANPGYFRGVPTPAIGMLVAGMALASWDHPGPITHALQSRWMLYALILLLCWLMISPLKVMKLAPPARTLPHLWPRAALLAGSLVLFLLFRFDAALPIFGLYILLSFVLPRTPAVDALVPGEKAMS